MGNKKNATIDMSRRWNYFGNSLKNEGCAAAREFAQRPSRYTWLKFSRYYRSNTGADPTIRSLMKCMGDVVNLDTVRFLSHFLKASRAAVNFANKFNRNSWNKFFAEHRVLTNKFPNKVMFRQYIVTNHSNEHMANRALHMANFYKN
jgi:hypothetical protein